MKKTILSLLALAVTALTFTACSDVPEPYQIPGTGGNSGGGEVAGATGSGQLTDPYNCVAANATGGTADWVFVKGKVSSIKEEYSTQFGNGTFYISDDGTRKNEFYVYRAYYLGNKKFASSDTQIKVGDEVIICGIITNYNGTIETTQNKGFIYELNGVNRGGDPTGSDQTGGEQKGTGTESDPFNVAAAVAKCKSVGETASAESYYIKGIADDDYTVDNFKNVTIDLVDKEGASEKFKIYRAKAADNKNIKEGYKINKGATIVVYGKVVNYYGNTPETVQNEAYIVSVDGQAPEVEGGSDTPTPTPTGEAKGTGTEADPFNVAAIIKYVSGLEADVDTKQDYYVKGIITEIPNNGISTQYNNLTFYISDDKAGTNKFYIFRSKGLNGGDVTENMIKVGDEVVIFGSTWVNYKGNTPETKQGEAYIVSITPGQNGGSNEPGEGGEVSGNALSVTFSDLGMANQEKPSTLTLSDGTTLTFDSGGNTNAPAYYNTGTAMRMYPKNTMTINAGSKKIAAIEIGCDEYNGTLYNASGDITANGTKMTIDGTNLKFTGPNASTATIANTSETTGAPSQLRMKKLKITYAE